MPTNLASLESTLADRRARYGSFEDVAETTHLISKAISDALAKNPHTLTPVMAVAFGMIANKLARIANGDVDYHDSWADVAGYATLVANTLEPEAE